MWHSLQRFIFSKRLQWSAIYGVVCLHTRSTEFVCLLLWIQIMKLTTRTGDLRLASIIRSVQKFSTLDRKRRHHWIQRPWLPIIAQCIYWLSTSDGGWEVIEDFRLTRHGRNAKSAARRCTLQTANNVSNGFLYPDLLISVCWHFPSTCYIYEVISVCKLSKKWGKREISRLMAPETESWITNRFPGPNSLYILLLWVILHIGDK
jgi:hypothetical protein